MLARLLERVLKSASSLCHDDDDTVLAATFNEAFDASATAQAAAAALDFISRTDNYSFRARCVPLLSPVAAAAAAAAAVVVVALPQISYTKVSQDY